MEALFVIVGLVFGFFVVRGICAFIDALCQEYPDVSWDDGDDV